MIGLFWFRTKVGRAHISGYSFDAKGLAMLSVTPGSTTELGREWVEALTVEMSSPKLSITRCSIPL